MFILNPSNYDFIFLLIVIASSLIALVRGGLNELLSLSVWIIVFLIMKYYGKNIDQFLPANITNNFLRNFIIFIIIFIITAIIITLIKNICSKIISTIGLGGLDRLLGVVFGILRGLLLFSIFIVIINLTNFDKEQNWKEAKTYPIVKPVIEWIVSVLPNQMKNIQTSIDFLYK